MWLHSPAAVHSFSSALELGVRASALDTHVRWLTGIDRVAAGQLDELSQKTVPDNVLGLTRHAAKAGDRIDVDLTSDCGRRCTADGDPQSYLFGGGSLESGCRTSERRATIKRSRQPRSEPRRV